MRAGALQPSTGGPGRPVLPRVPETADWRNRTDRYDPDRAGLAAGLLAKVRQEQLGEVGGLVAWTVDGEQVRGQADVDFCLGSHAGRCRYVPLGELWIEAVLPPSDAAPTLLHEAVECRLMVDHGQRYEEAHRLASQHERAMRRAVLDGEVLVTDRAGVLPAVQRWLERRHPEMLGSGGEA